jgi:hypothetical protein
MTSKKTSTTKKTTKAPAPESTGDLVSLAGNGQAVALPDDPYQRYAQAHPASALLKFSKGSWLLGEDQEEIDAGKVLIANPAAMQDGWLLFSDDNELLETKMLPVAEGMIPRPDDGLEWTEACSLELSDEAGEERYLFATCSNGGTRTCRKLFNHWNWRRRHSPNTLPKVKLGVSSYQHKKYGKIFKPELEIIDWVNADAPALAEALDDEVPF